MDRDDYVKENVRGIDRFETEALCDAESDAEIAERVRSKSGDLQEPEPQSDDMQQAVSEPSGGITPVVLVVYYN